MSHLQISQSRLDIQQNNSLKRQIASLSFVSRLGNKTMKGHEMEVFFYGSETIGHWDPCFYLIKVHQSQTGFHNKLLKILELLPR